MTIKNINQYNQQNDNNHNHNQQSQQYIALLQSELKKNYFALFDLEPSFIINKTHLKSMYYKKQKLFHPDNFINDSVDNKLVIELSAYINKAYNALLDDIDRSLELLKINNMPLNLNEDTKLNNEVIIKQMEIYESLEDVTSKVDYDNINNLNNSHEGTHKDHLNITNNEHLNNYNLIKSAIDFIDNHIKNLIIALDNAFCVKNFNQAKELTKELSSYMKMKNRIYDDYVI